MKFPPRKLLGCRAPEEEIRIGDGGLRAATVADGARIGSGGFGADVEDAGGIEAGERASAGADGVDVEHGMLMGRPATCASLAVLGSSSTSETSVEVPPMSKAMIFLKPLARAEAAAPTTPPAGPESTVRTGSRAAVESEVMPPEIA